MKDYRETVISVDQERMLLDRLLREEEDQRDVSHMTSSGNIGGILMSLSLGSVRRL